MPKKPLLIAILLATVILALVSVAGGALGDAFGIGFLASPIPTISLPAEAVVHIGGYAITNTALVFWSACIIILAVSYLGTRKMKMVPTGFQNFVEMAVEFFIGLVESVGGPAARRFLPLVMTIFLTVLIGNWLGVLPGVGTIGRVETPEQFLEHRGHSAEACDGLHDEELLVCAAGEEADTKLTVFDGSGSFKYIPFGRGESTKVTVAGIAPGDHPDVRDIEAGVVREPPVPDADKPDEHEDLRGKDAGVLVPFVRGANTDLNTTLAIALVAMFAIQFWGIRTLGVRGYGGKFINLKQGPVFFAVGILEIISEVARLISFTFRLFGNMFAGEILLVAMAFLFPLIGIIPFLGLELFVGLIQAFIFAMLTLVFAVVATAAHGEEGH